MLRALFDAAAAGRTILAPTNELAAALSDAVERLHLAAGHEVWPTPRIRDFAGWLRDLHAQRQGADAVLPRVLSEIEERELWRAVVMDSESGRALLEPAGAARAARRARRALIEYGIPARALADFPTEESLALSEWSRSFEERCRELHCIDADRLLESTPHAGHDLAWIESPGWRPVAHAWLEAHGGAILAPEAGARGTGAQRFQAASPEAELAAMAEWARDGLRTRSDFRAWLCIPDLHLRRADVQDAFDAVLAPERFSLSPRELSAPYALAGGMPLDGYAPVRAALNCLAATAGPVTVQAFSELLRMPEMQATPADAALAARLDVDLRARGRDVATLEEWLRLADERTRELPAAAVLAVRRLQAVLREVCSARRSLPLSGWVSVWVRAFDAGPWAERGRWSSAEFQAAERFRELLAALGVADASLGERTATSAAGLLRRAAHDTAFQVQTGIPPIWVSAQLTDPWLSYDGIWVAGCSEERWPPPVDPLPLLPVRLQREYGVVAASADAQLRLAAQLQHRWQARAPVSVFSCADPGDGRTGVPSPLVSHEPLHERPAPQPRPHWLALSLLAPPLETVMDERARRFGDPERTRGVATLKAQSLCAFRGFAETRLRTEALEHPTPGFNARERGEMLHAALEQVWSVLRNSAALQGMPPTQLDALLRDSVAHAIERVCARRDPGLRWRRREALRLRGLLGKWLEAEAVREPFEVERLEADVQQARHGGLVFDVRIDRVDRLADGARVLIDYKSGMAAADWRGERPDNPQLPIYALLRPERLVAVAYGRVNAGDCSFVAETERAGVFKPRGRASALEGLPDFAALMARWAERMERIAAEFAAGHAEVAPTPHACATCHLQPLCRVPTAFGEEADGDE